MGIKQDGLGIGEGYAMLAPVFLGFLEVLYYLHVPRVCIIYISVKVWSLFFTEAERRASGAAESGSAADAGGRRLQYVVRRRMW
jgi:hypothetical protein